LPKTKMKFAERGIASRLLLLSLLLAGDEVAALDTTPDWVEPPRMMLVALSNPTWPSTTLGLRAALQAGFNVSLVLLTDSHLWEMHGLLPPLTRVLYYHTKSLSLGTIARDCDAQVIVPIDSSAVAVLEQCIREKAPDHEVLLDLLGGETFLLWNHKQALKLASTELALPTAPHVIAEDMSELVAFLEEQQREGNGHRQILLKPDDLAGGASVVPCGTVACIEEALADATKFGLDFPLLAERYYPDSPKLSCVFTAVAGQISCYDMWISELDVRTFGSVAVARFVKRPDVLAWTQALVAAWNYTGIGQIQFLMANGEPKIMELNPRFGILMPYRLAVHVGHDCISALGNQLLSAHENVETEEDAPLSWPDELVGECLALLPLAVQTLARDRHRHKAYYLFGTEQQRCISRLPCYEYWWLKSVFGHRDTWLEPEERAAKGEDGGAASMEADSIENHFWQAFCLHGCNIEPATDPELAAEYWWTPRGDDRPHEPSPHLRISAVDLEDRLHVLPSFHEEWLAWNGITLPHHTESPEIDEPPQEQLDVVLG
jgi:hypothetical protein